MTLSTVIAETAGSLTGEGYYPGRTCKNDCPNNRHRHSVASKEDALSLRQVVLKANKDPAAKVASIVFLVYHQQRMTGRKCQATKD
eukprot:4519528-Amphidinium_carterae.1